MAIKRQTDKNNPKIIVIGLGEIGYHNAEYMTELGLSVQGFDINEKAVERALNANVIETEAKTFRDYDYYMICVSTHNPQNMYIPFLEGLLSVAERIAEEAKPGALVAIESTIPKGISQKVCSILNHKLHVAHVPHRYFNEEKKKHGVNQLRVLGGCKPCCSSEARHFYNDLLHIPLHPVTNIELAELTKVIENTHRFVEIAFAEELKMLCEDQALNFEELRGAVNTKWNENILEAREGIGGHCLPKDTRMYYNLSKHLLPSSIVAAALASDDLYLRYLNSTEDFGVIFPNQTITVEARQKRIHA